MWAYNMGQQIEIICAYNVGVVYDVDCVDCHRDIYTQLLTLA